MKLPKAVLEYVKKLQAKKHQQNICPLCHHKGLDYPDGGEIQDDYVSYYWDCPRCGARGYEAFTMAFSEHWIKDYGESEKVAIAKAKRALRARKNRRPRNAHA